METTSPNKKSSANTKEIDIEQKQNKIAEEVQNIFNATNVAIGVLEGPDHKYSFINPAACRMLHRTKEELLGKTVKEVFPEVEAQGIQFYDEVYNTGKPFAINELAVQMDILNDGITRQNYFNLSCQPLRDSGNKIYAILITAIDVTEQVQARKKVEDSEKRYNSMLMQSPFAFAVLKGKDMVVAMANDSIKQMWGKGENVEGKPLIEILPEIKDQEFPVLLHKVYTTGIPYLANETHVRMNRNGKMEDVYFNFVYQPYRETDDTISGVTIFATEVTTEAEFHKKIEENEKQQAFLLKLSDALRPLSNPIDIEEAATKTALDFMDADWCHYVTVKEDNLIIQRGASRDGFPSLTGVYPISSFTLFNAALNTGIPSIIDDVHTTTILDEDLKQLCIQLQNIAIVIVPIIKNGKPAGLLVLVQSKPRKWTDEEVQLTIETSERIWAAVERAKTEQTLKQSEEKYRMLFSSIDEAVSTIDIIFDGNQRAVDFLFIENNSAFTKLTGLPENVIGKRWLEFVPAIDPYVADIFERVIRTGESVRAENYVESLDKWHNTFFTLSGGVGSNRIMCV